MFDSIQNDIKREFTYGSMVSKLIIINIAVWVFFILLTVFSMMLGGFKTSQPDWYQNIIQFFMISSDWKHNLLHPWAIFTHMFLHEGLFHILMNMIFLYVFGRILGSYLGDHRILPVYVMGGLVAGIIYFITANVFNFGHNDTHFALGASGAVMAIVAASAFLVPDHELNLILIGPVKLKYIVLVLVVLDLISIGNNSNTGGHFAHLGGVAFGCAFIYLLQRGTDLSIPFNRYVEQLSAFWQRRKPSSDDKPPQNPRSKNMDEQEHLDEILVKIKKSGYDSLSEEEKEFLYNVSKKRR